VILDTRRQQIMDDGRQQTDLVERVIDHVTAGLIGGREVVEQLMACYLAGGHALIEGVPGIGKTLLARTFASSLGLGFARIQFTPDLMPSDVTGVNIFDRETAAFRFVPGPVFADVLMADEINRTPPKTQAALLEAMQERQVTLDGATHSLGGIFFVMATQNPTEFEGTYPLPEAQRDRFVARVSMGLPVAEAELEIYRRAVTGELTGWSPGVPDTAPCVSPDEARGLRGATTAVTASDDTLRYLQRLAAEVRQSPHVDLGVSPRAGLSLLELGRASAMLEGRDFLIPDDLKRFVIPCWAHRVVLHPESELEGKTPEGILSAVMDAVAVPH
jgi:MoxR-like ATPase